MAAATAPPQQQTLLGYASSLLGVPYLWGGTNPSTGLDCSGFVQNVFSRLGVNLPRVSQAQSTVGQSIDYRSAQAGDLVFYDVPGEGRASHVGIYLGNGLMMDAPHTGASVQVEPLWQGAYFRRVPLPKGAQVGVATGTAGQTASEVTGADGASGINAPAATHYSMADLESQYGYAAKFFASDKTLQGLINQAVKNQWTPDAFKAHLEGTKWFTTHTAAQRAAIQLQTNDPAEWARQIHDEERNIALLATQEGVRLTQQQVNQLAATAIHNGYTDDQTKQSVVNLFKADTTQGQVIGGQAGADYSQLKQLAVNYGVPMTEQSYDDWTTKILNGGSTVDDYTNYVKQQASNLYPGLSDAIAKGQTTMDATASYRQLMGNVLELPADQVSLQDPLMKKLLSSSQPSNTASSGGSSSSSAQPPGVMPLWQFEQSLKSDPRWMQTNNARDQFTSAGLKIGQDLGFTATAPGSFGGG